MPLFMVLLVGLPRVVDERRPLDTLASNFRLVIPGQATVFTRQVEPSSPRCGRRGGSGFVPTLP
jgi:hypothetical protein